MSHTRRDVLRAALAAASVATLPACTAPPTPPGEWRNWSGGQTARPRAFLRPRNEADLIRSLRAAEGTVRVTGAGHSFSALCTTDDTLVSLDHLTGITEHDDTTLQATVWAGTRLRDLGEPLWNLGQGLINQGDVDPQSVAGACGTSTHGTGLGLGSFSSVMRGLRLVTPRGESIEANTVYDSDVYQAARCSLGALGIASQIRLQNRRPYSLHQREYTEPLESVLKNLDASLKAHRHYEFWAFFESEDVLVKTLDETSADATSPPMLDLPADLILKAASELAHAWPKVDGVLQRFITNVFPASEKIDRSYRVFPSARETRFNEMEYEVPMAQGPDCLREILAAVRQQNLNNFFPIEYRVVAADDAWLSPFYQRESASISIHQYHEVDYRPLFSFVEPIFWKYGGRPHWGKLHTLTHDRLAALYPKWDDWQRIRRRLDPQGRMLNAHLRTLLEPA